MGENVAIGSLITTTQYFKDSLSPIDHILYALRAASDYYCGIQGLFIIINTKSDDVLTIDK